MHGRPSLMLLSVSLLLAFGCAGGDESGGEPSTQTGFQRDGGRGGLRLDNGLPQGADGNGDAGIGNTLTDAGEGLAREDAETVMGDPACLELANCLADCDNPECSLACRRAAPVDSTALYDAIFACGSDNDCNAPGGGYDTQCLSMHCAEEQEACLGPPAPPPPPPMGDLTCSELEGCLVECPSGDTNCRDNCVAAASPTGYDQLVALQTCASNAACEDSDSACVVRTCQNEIRTCFGSVIVPMGTNDCRALNLCLAECSDNDQPCVDNCFIASSDEGYNSFQSLSRCVRSSNCPAGDGNCQRAACGPEFEGCFGPAAPPPTGNLDCAGLNDCVQMCGENNQVCVNACIGNSSQAGYDQLVAIYDCFDRSMCADNDGECRQMACQMQLEACFGPIAMPMGNMTCAQFNTCLSNCADNDRMCTDNCVRQSSPAGYALFNAAIRCIEDAMCLPDDAQCQQINCGNEIQACLGFP